MTDYSNYSDAERAVTDPSTSAADLADIAEQHPKLWRQIADHPAAYRSLLKWLATVGDDEVKEAVAARGTPVKPAKQQQHAAAAISDSEPTESVPLEATTTAEEPSRAQSLLDSFASISTRKVGNSRITWLAAGVILLLVVVLIAMLLASLPRRSENDQAQWIVSHLHRDQQPTTTDNGGVRCGAVTLPEGVDARACGGIPVGAISTPTLSWYGQMFEMPSHNIGCYTYFGGITCEIGTRTWETPSSFMNDCNHSRSQHEECNGSLVNISDDGTLGVIAHDGSPPWRMAKRDKAKILVLQYGETTAFSSVACLSAFDGVTCWDISTHHGFKMSKSTFKYW